jgi:hypothetical protein
LAEISAVFALWRLLPLAMYIIGSGTRVEGFAGTVHMHQMAWRVPIDDDSHWSFEAIFRGEMHVNEVDERRPDIVGIQDTVTMECSDASATVNPTGWAGPTSP